MKKTFQITIAMSLLALAFCMTGCEALFPTNVSPLAAPVVTTDPKTGAAMPDNDTQILSESAKIYALKKFDQFKARKGVSVDVWLLPSSKIVEFVNNNDQHRQSRLC